MIKSDKVQVVETWQELIEKIKAIKNEWKETQNDGNEPVIWYRGHSSKEYELIPSLYRFKNGAEKEQTLFQEYKKFEDYVEPGESAKNKNNTQDDIWYRLVNMQHYGIPTRLLDWTEVFGIALFFAVSEAPDQPCIYILNPTRLNTLSGEPNIPKVPSNTNFESQKAFPDIVFPKAICVDKYSNPRIRSQCGTFTIHGSRKESLDELQPDCVQKIILQETVINEAKDYLKDFNINMFSLFPDIHGLKKYIVDSIGLKPFGTIDINIQKIKKDLKQEVEEIPKIINKPLKKDDLFSVDVKNNDTFNKPFVDKEVMNEIRIIFTNNLITLSKKAALDTKKPAEEWIVIDNDNSIRYYLKREEDKLNVSQELQPKIRYNWDIIKSFMEFRKEDNGNGDFIKRDDELEKLDDWLRDNSKPIAFLTGEAGIGKSYLLYDWIFFNKYTKDPTERKAFLFYNLREYKLSEDKLNDATRTFIKVLMDKFFMGESITSIEKSAFEKAIEEGEMVIVLDGLDELERTEGSDKVKELLDEFKEYIKEKSKAKILISCRQKNYEWFLKTNILKLKNEMLNIEVEELQYAEIQEKIQALLKKINDGNLIKIQDEQIKELVKLAQHPLYLKVIMEMLKEKYKPLMESLGNDIDNSNKEGTGIRESKRITKSLLYNYWFDYICMKANKANKVEEANKTNKVNKASKAKPSNVNGDDKNKEEKEQYIIRKTITRVAWAMLDYRTEVISDEELKEWGKWEKGEISPEEEEIIYKFNKDLKDLSIGEEKIPPIFAGVSKDSITFIHQSMKEFLLVWSEFKDMKIYRGGGQQKEDLIGALTGTKQFDFAGSIVYSYLVGFFDDSNTDSDKKADIYFTEWALEAIKYGRDKILKPAIALKENGEPPKRKYTYESEEQYSNLIRNLIEAIGLITRHPHNDDVVQLLFKYDIIDMLDPRRVEPHYSYCAGFNIARCLVRLHPASFKESKVYEESNGLQPSDPVYIFRYVIVGAHDKEIHINPINTMRGYQFNELNYESNHPYFKNAMKISMCLLDVIENLDGPELAEEAKFMRINCSYALVRWFPFIPLNQERQTEEHKKLLKKMKIVLSETNLDHHTAVNLFAILYLRFHDKIPEDFQGKFGAIRLNLLKIDKQEENPTKRQQLLTIKDLLKEKFIGKK